jgi:hypothetical protein
VPDAQVFDVKASQSVVPHRQSPEAVRQSGFSDGQVFREPLHCDATHWSLRVQAFPSLHEIALAVYTQPDAFSQPSSVQALPSSQTRAAAPVHVPAWQLSPVVQASWSLHPVPFVLGDQSFGFTDGWQDWQKLPGRTVPDVTQALLITQ